MAHEQMYIMYGHIVYDCFAWLRLMNIEKFLSGHDAKDCKEDEVPTDWIDVFVAAKLCKSNTLASSKQYNRI